jgi:hypothetical protein
LLSRLGWYCKLVLLGIELDCPLSFNERIL